MELPFLPLRAEVGHRLAGMLGYRNQTWFQISEWEHRMPVTFERLRYGAVSAMIAVSIYGTIPAHATDVVTEWSTIQMPPAPTLKPVTIDAKTTALTELCRG